MSNPKRPTKVVELRREATVEHDQLAQRLLRSGAIERSQELLVGDTLRAWFDCQSPEARERLWHRAHALLDAYEDIIAELSGENPEHTEELRLASWNPRLWCQRAKSALGGKRG